MHRVHGEPLAVLAGDALIVLAFQVLADAAMLADAALLAHGAAKRAWCGVIGRGVGVPSGYCGGPGLGVRAGGRSGAVSAGEDGRVVCRGDAGGGGESPGVEAEPWRALGLRLGEAYQVADDLRDAVCSADELGKPVGQDLVRTRGRMRWRTLGLDVAIALVARTGRPRG